MKRIVSLWFPKLSTDRLARATPDWSARPLRLSSGSKAVAPDRAQPACPHRGPAPAHAARRCARPPARPGHDIGRTAGRPSADRDHRQLVRPLHALGGDRSAGRRHRRGRRRGLQHRRLRRRCRAAARRHRLRHLFGQGEAGERALLADLTERLARHDLTCARPWPTPRGRPGRWRASPNARPISSARRAAIARLLPNCQSKACGSTRRSWKPS